MGLLRSWLHPRTFWRTLMPLLLLPLVALLGVVIAAPQGPRADVVTVGLVDNDLPMTRADGTQVALGRDIVAALVAPAHGPIRWLQLSDADATLGIKDGRLAAIAVIPRGLSAAAVTSTSGRVSKDSTITIFTPVQGSQESTAVSRLVASAARTAVDRSLTASYLDQLYLATTRAGGTLQSATSAADQVVGQAGTMTTLAENNRKSSQALASKMTQLSKASQQVAATAERSTPDLRPVTEAARTIDSRLQDTTTAQASASPDQTGTELGKALGSTRTAQAGVTGIADALKQAGTWQAQIGQQADRQQELIAAHQQQTQALVSQVQAVGVGVDDAHTSLGQAREGLVDLRATLLGRGGGDDGSRSTVAAQLRLAAQSLRGAAQVAESQQAGLQAVSSAAQAQVDSADAVSNGLVSVRGRILQLRPLVTPSYCQVGDQGSALACTAYQAGFLEAKVQAIGEIDRSGVLVRAREQQVSARSLRTQVLAASKANTSLAAGLRQTADQIDLLASQLPQPGGGFTEEQVTQLLGPLDQRLASTQQQLTGANTAATRAADQSVKVNQNGLATAADAVIKAVGAQATSLSGAVSAVTSANTQLTNSMAAIEGAQSAHRQQAAAHAKVTGELQRLRAAGTTLAERLAQVDKSATSPVPQPGGAGPETPQRATPDIGQQAADLAKDVERSSADSAKLAEAGRKIADSSGSVATGTKTVQEQLAVATVPGPTPGERTRIATFATEASPAAVANTDGLSTDWLAVCALLAVALGGMFAIVTMPSLGGLEPNSEGIRAAAHRVGANVLMALLQSVGPATVMALAVQGHSVFNGRLPVAGLVVAVMLAGIGSQLFQSAAHAMFGRLGVAFAFTVMAITVVAFMRQPSGAVSAVLGFLAPYEASIQTLSTLSVGGSAVVPAARLVVWVAMLALFLLVCLLRLRRQPQLA